MRRTLIATVLLAVLALLGPASSAQTADEGKGEETATLEIVKVVDGEGPIGGYVIEYTCIEDGIDVSPAEGGGSGGSLAFDAAGPGSPETQTIVLTNAATCTVTETDSNGATTVTYACAYVASENPSSPSGGFATEGLQEGGCLDVQSAYIGAPGDVATITVTNTFDADEPPAVDDDDVVDATPAFTG